MNGISEKQKKAKRDQIILKCIENSYTTHITSVISLGWKSELFNLPISSFLKMECMYETSVKNHFAWFLASAAFQLSAAVPVLVVFSSLLRDATLPAAAFVSLRSAFAVPLAA